MPRIVPQHLKAIYTIQQQPDRLKDYTEIMMYAEIAGKSNNEIAQLVGLSFQRASTIRNSPLYRQQMDVLKERMRAEAIDKTTNRALVNEKLEDLALSAVDKYKELLDKAESQFVQKATADAILDRTGHKAFTEKTKVSVEVTERMASRFDKVLGYDEPSENARKTKISVEEKVSS